MGCVLWMQIFSIFKKAIVSREFVKDCRNECSAENIRRQRKATRRSEEEGIRNTMELDTEDNRGTKRRRFEEEQTKIKYDAG